MYLVLFSENIFIYPWHGCKAKKKKNQLSRSNVVNCTAGMPTPWLCLVVQWSVHWAPSRTTWVLVLARARCCALGTCRKKMQALLLGLAKSQYYTQDMAARPKKQESVVQKQQWLAFPPAACGRSGAFFNPLTPKIWFLILPSSCYKFPHQLVMRIWC